MKSLTRMAITTLGGAAALAFAVGFGGVGASPVGTTPATTAHTSSNVAPAPPSTAATGGITSGGAGVHIATLTGCVLDLDC
jgi:hypothetical protein